MSDSTASSPTGSAGQSTERSGQGSGASRLRSTLWRYTKRGVGSGLFAGVAGVWNLVRVRRALRNESSDDAVRKSFMAVFWLGVAAIQWRSRGSSDGPGSGGDVDQTDVVDIAPDIEAVSSGSQQESASNEDATSIEVTEANPAPDNDEEVPDDAEESDVVDTGSDIEDADEADEE